MKSAITLILALTGGLVMAAQPHHEDALDGSWGSPQLRLTMNAKGGEIEMGCASGTINAPIMRAKNGSFSARGTFEQQESGGPQRADEGAPVNHAASYRGTVSGGVMTLTILPAGSRTPQVFQLRKGARSKIIRCL